MEHDPRPGSERQYDETHEQWAERVLRDDEQRYGKHGLHIAEPVEPDDDIEEHA